MPAHKHRSKHTQFSGLMTSKLLDIRVCVLRMVMTRWWANRCASKTIHVKIFRLHLLFLSLFPSLLDQQTSAAPRIESSRWNVNGEYFSGFFLSVFWLLAPTLANVLWHLRAECSRRWSLYATGDGICVRKCLTWWHQRLKTSYFMHPKCWCPGLIVIRGNFRP